MSDDETGLQSGAEVHQFVQSTYAGAVTSMSAEDRANQVMAAVNQRLAAEGVPQVKWDWGVAAAQAGQFSFRTWTMALGKKAFDPAAYEAGQVADHADLLDTVYHEARHAEQWYRQARERAGLGATAEQIAATTGIPHEIADAATANPIIECDRAQYEAEAWFQSVYGSGAAHRKETLKDVAHHYDDYRNLPEEADAWKTAGKVTDEYDDLGEPGNE